MAPTRCLVESCASDEQLMPKHSTGEEPHWRQIRVTVDFLDGIYDAWSSPAHWGEYASPCFETDEAQRLAVELRAKGIEVRYDASLDTFFIKDRWTTGEWEVWGHDFEHGHTYDIGAGMWKWREVGSYRQPLELYQHFALWW